MEVNGWKNYKMEVNSMKENIRISINILPFGKTKLIFNLSRVESTKDKFPIYTEPHSTDMQEIQILYPGSSGEYKNYETTDGK